MKVKLQNPSKLFSSKGHLPLLFRCFHVLKVRVKQNPNQRNIFIRPQTAVWLFQEGERVSSDRLFRVRCKQPYCTTTSLVKQTVNSEAAQPIVSSTVQIGELQVNGGWKIGRVLQFSKYQEKTVSAQQFKGSSADVTI